MTRFSNVAPWFRFSMVLIASLAVACLAAVCIAASMDATWQFWFAMGDTKRSAYTYASAMVALDGMKALAPIVIMQAWANSKWVCLKGAVVFFAIAVLISLGTGIGFAAKNRDATMTDVSSANAKLAAATANTKEIETRLSRFPVVPLADTTRSKIAVLKKHYLWKRTKGCTDDTARKSRKFCGNYETLKGQLKVAEKIDTERNNLGISRKRESDLRDKGAGRESNPQAATIARLIWWKVVATDDVELVLRVVIAGFIELGASLGLFLAFGHGGLSLPPRRTREGDIVTITQNPGIREIPKFESEAIAPPRLARMLPDDTRRYNDNGALILEPIPCRK